MTKVITSSKCTWALGNTEMEKYHDEEWGVPQFDDKTLFEFLVLESAQAGLSWQTILNKREHYRVAYKNFNVDEVAKFQAKDIEELLNNKRIVRNKLKIEASINNAKKFQDVQNEFGSFSNYLWGFVENTPIINNFKTISEVPTKTELSDTISKDLKKRGFKFIGSTIIYSYLQAVGVVNDHIVGCQKKY